MKMVFSFQRMVIKLILLSLFSFLPSLVAVSQVLTPVKWSYEARILNDKEAELVFTALIDDTWHLYSQDLPPGGPVKTSFNFESLDGFKFVDEEVKIEEFEGWEEGSKLYSVVFNEPVAKEEFDPNFDMVVKYFAYRAEFRRKIELTTDKPLTISGYLEFMCCDDSKCLPPSEVEFQFAFNLSEQTPIPSQSAAPSQPASISSGSSAISDGQIGDDTTLLLLFIFSFIAGLLAILTPCVFPMIPMTVTFFMSNSENKIKARFQAITYGLSIIVIYTVVGTVVAVTLGANFANWLSTHWIPNILFFLIFTFFAASFLGMFEIVLPSWMINKTDSKADQGGFSGSFFMAFTLVLVSFSCTGPIVGAILVKSAGGQVLEPIVGMFGFSLAFALPFTLFAFFPSWLANLPKSGGWLNAVKVVLGFIELALGLKFLSIADQTYHWGILDREIYLAFWIVIFTLMGFYLLGKLKFAHDSDLPYIGVPRLLLAILTFTFVFYMIPGMFGAPLKMLSGYLPPQQSQDFDINAIVRDNLRIYGGSAGNLQSAKKELCEKPKYSEKLHLPHGLEGYFDFEQGMACARELNKPVFIDFTGHGCVNCREMEANVWSDPKVLQLLRDEFIIIALYVDDKSRLPEEDWVISTHDGKVKNTLGKKYADFQISRFNVNAQPYYVLMDTNEEMLVRPMAYNLNVNAFVDFLNNGIDEFKKRK